MNKKQTYIPRVGDILVGLHNRVLLLVDVSNHDCGIITARDAANGENYSIGSRDILSHWQVYSNYNHVPEIVDQKKMNPLEEKLDALLTKHENTRARMVELDQEFNRLGQEQKDTYSKITAIQTVLAILGDDE